MFLHFQPIRDFKGAIDHDKLESVANFLCPFLKKHHHKKSRKPIYADK
jgi:hypothetical protein